MDVAHLQLLITDADAVPLSGLSFYFPAVAETTVVEIMDSLAEITTADAKASSGFYYCFAAVAETTAADANFLTDSFHHIKRRSVKIGSV